jgi:hypothetical protein
MAKISKDEARADWAEAEARFREVAEKYLADGGKLDKDAALAISKARAKADKRMATYFKRVLD